MNTSAPPRVDERIFTFFLFPCILAHTTVTAIAKSLVSKVLVFSVCAVAKVLLSDRNNPLAVKSPYFCRDF